MGHFETTMGKIMGARSQMLEVKLEKGGKEAVLILRAVTKAEQELAQEKIIEVSNANVASVPKEPTFLDYLRSGWQMNLALAIDYTASNGDPDEDDCLHYMSP